MPEVGTPGTPGTGAPDVVGDLLARVEEARVGDERIVMIVDGRSGSGKTTLARRLVAAWPDDALGPVQLVHLDDVYPGWRGLQAASAAVAVEILVGDRPGWTTWDWADDRPGPRRSLDPAASVVVEGAGSLTRASAVLATISVWLELDEETRRARALGRDGQAYEPWWDVWAQQEVEHLERERPRELADLVVDVGRGDVVTGRPRRAGALRGQATRPAGTTS